MNPNSKPFYKIPSKTFVLGEYGVLKNSPSLVLCSAPHFQISNNPQSATFGQGPIQQFLRDFQVSGFEFTDPWKGSGGFGASSAQFAFLYQQVESLRNLDSTYVDRMLSTYRKYFSTPTGWPPSGHDVIAQLMGDGLQFIDIPRGVFKKVDVILPEHDLLILKTSLKIATHDHLSSLQDIDFDLRETVEQALQGFENGNLLQVVSAFEEQNRVLTERNLVAQETVLLRQQLELEPGVIITKGCGALGADTILIVCENDKSAAFLERHSSAFMGLRAQPQR